MRVSLQATGSAPDASTASQVAFLRRARSASRTVTVRPAVAGASFHEPFRSATTTTTLPPLGAALSMRNIWASTPSGRSRRPFLAIVSGSNSSTQRLPIIVSVSGR